MEPNQKSPGTASSLNETWLRVTGKDKWMPTIATVFSCEWRGLSNQIDSQVGFYDVVYSYSVDGERYTGKFSDYGLEDEDYLKPNDTFEIRVNPTNPKCSFYPELRTRTQFNLIAVAIGAALGLVVLLLSLLFASRSR